MEVSIQSCEAEVCTESGLELIHFKRAGPGTDQEVTGLSQA